MILEIIATIALFAFLALIHFFWLKPRKTMKFYENALNKLKYNAKIFPYRPTYNACYDPLVQGMKKSQPLMVYRKDYQGYDIVLTNAFNKPVIQILHVDFLKDFFSVDKHYNYPKIQMIKVPFVRLIGDGIGFTEGKVWKQKKAVLSVVFNFEFVKSQIKNMVNICDISFNQMEKKCLLKQDQTGKYVETNLLNDLMNNIFAQIILKGFLGIKDKQYIEGIEASLYLINLANDMATYQLKSPTLMFGNWFYDRQFRNIDKDINQRQNKLREWGLSLIQKKVSQIQKQLKQIKDISKYEIDDMIKAFVIYKKQHKLQDENKLVSDSQILNLFVGNFLGGTDTTANYTNMMIMFIAKYPHVQQKVREQVNQYMKQDDYSYQNLKNFKYIQSLQKETTRMYGPANAILTRQALKDDYINGLPIKKGTWISAISTTNHYSEKYFKQPLQFRPQRWLNGECDDLNLYVLLGFSAGGRSCPGKQLALLQSKIAIIKIMKRYKKIQIPKKDFKMCLKFVQCPEDFKTKLTLF